MTSTSPSRPRAKRIALINHKGGVGKTTLTFNIASALADMGRRVLLVDADPQCNLTAQSVDISALDSLLDESDGPDGATLWSAVKPIVEASGGPRVIPVIERPKGIGLLPGDIRMAEFEEELAEYWADCFRRKQKGYRGMSALSTVIGAIASSRDLDYVFYDTGPSVGALNRAIVLDCDFVIVPTAYDLFSLRAIKTLGHELARWIDDWKTVIELAPDGTYLLPGLPRLLGYIPQRHRVYAGVPATNYAAFKPRLEKQISEDIVKVLRRLDSRLAPPDASLLIGEVKDFSFAAPEAQTRGIAISELSGQHAQAAADAARAFADIASEIERRTNGAD